MIHGGIAINWAMQSIFEALPVLKGTKT